MSDEVVIEKSGAVKELNLPLPRLDIKDGQKTTKIREMYDTGKFAKGTLFMATTDRVSVKDKVLLSGIPGKGKVLTKFSVRWFEETYGICSNHLITDEFELLPNELQEVLEPYKSVLDGRFMLVWKGEPILLECIVRGRLLGSSNDSYQETGKVCGIKLPEGLKKGDDLIPPIFTPSTKAEKGQHDENITFEQAEKLVSVKTARYLRKKSLELFKYISMKTLLSGIELTDTKFEYIYFKRGNKKTIMVSDEIATPDSSRFEPDFSKEPLRDWLDSIGWDGTPIELPERIVTETSQRYIKGCEILTGYKVTV